MDELQDWAYPYSRTFLEIALLLGCANLYQSILSLAPGQPLPLSYLSWCISVKAGIFGSTIL